MSPEHAMNKGSAWGLGTAFAAMRVAVLLGAVLSAAGAAAAEPPSDRLNFVACPIVRDTATVPCWLAEHDGELYYLGIQTDISADFDPPYLGHRALIEGAVSDAPRICGGIVLEPVVVSPMLEPDASCNTILPADDRYTVPFAPRPPGPSGGRLAFQPPPGAAAPPPAPTGPQTFVLNYDFDRLMMGRHSGVLTAIFDYARRAEARRIVVTGEAGATLLSDGDVLAEDPTIARDRAAEVKDHLARAGLDAAIIEVAEPPRARRPDGVDDWKSRRTTVVVEPR